ncbi:MAG TPA: helix-turn-helix transcriptional regulator [Polyangiaceae bacterium]
MSVERPETLLRDHLTAAEYDVTCKVLEGASYAEISVCRSKSNRTVANQMASVFHRLGVSGRSALIARLLCAPAG